MLAKIGFLLLGLLLCCQSPPADAAIEHGTWGYSSKDGPSTWPVNFKQFCAGRKQSPVDLGLRTSEHDPQLAEYAMQEAESSKYTILVENDGHKLQATIGDGLQIKIGLGDTMYYTAAQVHWHWGSDHTKGSEHTITNKSYPMEGHLVFWNSYDYPNISTALHRVGGLAVLGVFYELALHDNPLIAALEPYISMVTKPYTAVNATFNATDLNFLNAFLPRSTRHFYRYEGSLTTPTCNENVLWTVFTRTVPISERQLNLMRSLRYPDGKPCVNNYRPVQPLNSQSRPGANRVVFRSFDRWGLILGDLGYNPKGAARGRAASVASLTLAAVALIGRFHV